MSVLVDTDVLIEVSRSRNSEVVSAWVNLGNSGEPLLCSAVTVAEMWHGARPIEREPLTRLFQSLVCVAVDELAGRLAGEFLRQFHKSHSVGLADALIAASAVQHRSKLWTRNRKHFPMREIAFYEEVADSGVV